MQIARKVFGILGLKRAAHLHCVRGVYTRDVVRVVREGCRDVVRVVREGCRDVVRLVREGKPPSPSNLTLVRTGRVHSYKECDSK